MPDNHRIEAFSDGVFAIVVTIMVLGIRISDSLAFGNAPRERALERSCP